MLLSLGALRLLLDLVRVLIDPAMKFRDSILVGRVVPNAPRRIEDNPPYHRSHNI